MTAYESENITITIKVIRAHPPVLPHHISWTYITSNGSARTMNQSIEEGYDSRFNISEDGRSLYFSDLTSDDDGCYQVLIWHPAGYKNKTTYLNIIKKEQTTNEGNYKSNAHTCIILISIVGTTEASSTSNRSIIATISTALGLGMTIMILCVIIISIIVYNKRKNKKEAMMIFEMESR